MEMKNKPGLINNKNGALTRGNRPWILLWFGIIFFLQLAPFLFFGIPGFWGDDLHIIQELDNSGLSGTIAKWIDEYGYAYRPIGYSLLSLSYFLFSFSAESMFILSLLSYLLLTYLVYLFSLQQTGSPGVSICITSLFCFSPFSYTAILQFSSLYMIYSFILVMVIFILRDSERLQNKTMLKVLSSTLWLVILLMYEQAIGLLALLIIMEFYGTFDGHLLRSAFRTIKSNTLIITVTLTFLVFYFLTPGNPKVNSVTQLNDLSESISLEQKNAEPKKINSATTTRQHNEVANSFYNSRIEALLSKSEKVLTYFLHNATYAIEQVLSSTWLAAIIVTVFIIFHFITNKLVSFGPSKQTARVLCGFGIIWGGLCLLPFFLYSSLHIPVYGLVLPWIGVSFFVGSLFLLTKNLNGKQIPLLLFSLCLFFCYLQQIGFQVGLKNELGQYASYAQASKNNHSNYPENVSHIFWLNNIILSRHQKAVSTLNPKLFSIDRKDSHIVRRAE